MLASKVGARKGGRGEGSYTILALKVGAEWGCTKGGLKEEGLCWPPS